MLSDSAVRGIITLTVSNHFVINPGLQVYTQRNGSAPVMGPSVTIATIKTVTSLL